MSPATVILSLICSCVAFFFIGAWAAFELNPSAWPMWLRGTTGIGAFLFWAYDINKPA